MRGGQSGREPGCRLSFAAEVPDRSAGQARLDEGVPEVVDGATVGFVLDEAGVLHPREVPVVERRENGLAAGPLANGIDRLEMGSDLRGLGRPTRLLEQVVEGVTPFLVCEDVEDGADR